MEVRTQITRDAETKLYFLVFFFFTAAMASIIYNVAMDVYVIGEANAQNINISRPHKVNGFLKVINSGNTEQTNGVNTQ